MSSKLFQSVVAAFDGAGWEYEQVPGREGQVLRAGFDAHHTRVELHVQAFDEIRAISVVAEAPLTTDNPARRERIAELAMRSNESLSVGAFEMLWDRGLLMFRLTNLFESETAGGELVTGMVHAVIAEMDRISPALTEIHRVEGADLAALDVAALVQREDWLPPVGESVGDGNDPLVQNKAQS